MENMGIYENSWKIWKFHGPYGNFMEHMENKQLDIWKIHGNKSTINWGVQRKGPNWPIVVSIPPGMEDFGDGLLLGGLSLPSNKKLRRIPINIINQQQATKQVWNTAWIWWAINWYPVAWGLNTDLVEGCWGCFFTDPQLTKLVL